MGRKRTTETDALATRNSIVETAETLFRTIGYCKTTVADVAKALGMSPANVYRYFPAKSAINEVICDRVVRRIEDRCRPFAEGGPSARGRLTAFVLEYHRAVRDNVIREQHLQEMVVKAVGLYRAIIQDHVDRMDVLMREILRQGVAEGAFKDLDVATAALALQNAISAFTYPALVEMQLGAAASAGGEKQVENDLVDMMNLLMSGMCRES